jgi:hypothetical protein
MSNVFVLLFRYISLAELPHVPRLRPTALAPSGYVETTDVPLRLQRSGSRPEPVFEGEDRRQATAVAPPRIIVSARPTHATPELALRRVNGRTRNVAPAPLAAAAVRARVIEDVRARQARRSQARRRGRSGRGRLGGWGGGGLTWGCEGGVGFKPRRPTPTPLGADLQRFDDLLRANAGSVQCTRRCGSTEAGWALPCPAPKDCAGGVHSLRPCRASCASRKSRSAAPVFCAARRGRSRTVAESAADAIVKAPARAVSVTSNSLNTGRVCGAARGDCGHHGSFAIPRGAYVYV